ncbi:hypothetical protein [Actinosynnema sp. NPDC023587]
MFGLEHGAQDGHARLGQGPVRIGHGESASAISAVINQQRGEQPAAL